MEDRTEKAGRRPNYLSHCLLLPSVYTGQVQNQGSNPGTLIADVGVLFGFDSWTRCSLLALPSLSNRSVFLLAWVVLLLTSEAD